MLPLPLPSTAPPQSLKWHSLTTRTSPLTLPPFFYGVLATKIYCRPTCPARLARRANVVYFASLSAAEAEGYRACKRCRPDDMLFIGEAEEVVMRAMGVFGRFQGKGKGEKGERAGLEAIAKQTGVSKSYLCRVFKKTMGMTVGEYIKEFEKDGKGFVDEVSMETEDLPTMDEICSPGAVDQCRKDDCILRSNSIEERTPPDMDAELDYGQWICTEKSTSSPAVRSI